MEPCGTPSRQSVRVSVRPWIDPVVEAHGFGPSSPYVEHCWLPVLGPTATWLYRRLGSLVVEKVDGGQVDLVDLAQALGLGRGLGRHSPLVHSLDRLRRFGVIQVGGETLLVRRALALLPVTQARRLPPSARQWHDAAVAKQIIS